MTVYKRFHSFSSFQHSLSHPTILLSFLHSSTASSYLSFLPAFLFCFLRSFRPQPYPHSAQSIYSDSALLTLLNSMSLAFLPSFLDPAIPPFLPSFLSSCSSSFVSFFLFVLNLKLVQPPSLKLYGPYEEFRKLRDEGRREGYCVLRDSSIIGTVCENGEGKSMSSSFLPFYLRGK